jgi:hypothetical protein
LINIKSKTPCTERDRQKWLLVLHPIGLQNEKGRMILPDHAPAPGVSS